MLPDKIRIGTAGFSYKDWLGNFYPQFCPQADFLKFYTSKFNTVELDSTYYRIPPVETVKKWAATTPDSFVFTAKFPNTVTHEGSLEERIKNAGIFIDVMSHLGSKLGPLLLQFPYSFKPDRIGDLMALIAALPDQGRFAIELRNKAWLKEERLFDRLKEKNIAFCLIDHPWMPRTKICTADFHYLRFLGDRKKIEADFSYVRFERREELAWWGDLVTEYSRQGVGFYAYFNNHYSGHAPTTAEALIELLRQAV